MRLVSFGARGEERFGLLVGGRIVDVAAASGGALPDSLRRFLTLAGPPPGESAAGGDLWLKLARLAADIDALAPRAVVERAAVRLGPPVTDPSKLVCLGLNYHDHARELGQALPERPLLFAKAPSALAGAEDPIVYPADVERLDYEVELALIVGRRAKDVPAAGALGVLAGYAVMNDVSARCAQVGDGQWFRAKSYDTFAPLGEALVTPDEVGDPGRLRLTTRVNGELRQNSTTADLIRGLPEIVAWVSRCMTLEPGDVIATGTPGGVAGFKASGKHLRRGDRVELEVERVGRLKNRVV